MKKKRNIRFKISQSQKSETDIEKIRELKKKQLREWKFDYSNMNNDAIDAFGTPVIGFDKNNLIDFLQNKNMTVLCAGGNFNIVMFYNPGTYYNWLALYERYAFEFSGDSTPRESIYKASLWYKNTFEDMLQLLLTTAEGHRIPATDIRIGVKINYIEEKIAPILEKYATGEYKWLDKKDNKNIVI